MKESRSFYGLNEVLSGKKWNIFKLEKRGQGSWNNLLRKHIISAVSLKVKKFIRNM